jgi:hypothetical protein
MGLTWDFGFWILDWFDKVIDGGGSGQPAFVGNPKSKIQNRDTVA